MHVAPKSSWSVSWAAAVARRRACEEPRRPRVVCVVVREAALTRILAYSYFTRTSTSRLRTNPSKRPERDTGYWRTYLPKIGLPVPGTLADVWPGDPRNLPGWGFDPEADEDDPRNMIA